MKWLVIAGAFVVPILAVVTFAATRHDASTSPSQPSQGPYRGSEPPGRILLPGFRLPTYDRRIIARQDLRGRVVLTTFVDSACKESCPIIVAALGAALHRLDAATRRSVAAVAFSVDPKVDTSRHVQTFLRDRHAEGEVTYAVASARRMRPVWSAFHVLPAVDTGNTEIHSADIRVFDRRGLWVSTLNVGADLTVANLVHDIVTALARS
jgi:cytochrome oxidase Cu insertion factor (SCO1/SenC/PrrC family)